MNSNQIQDSRSNANPKSWTKEVVFKDMWAQPLPFLADRPTLWRGNFRRQAPAHNSQYKKQAKIFIKKTIFEVFLQHCLQFFKIMNVRNYTSGLTIAKKENKQKEKRAECVCIGCFFCVKNNMSDTGTGYFSNRRKIFHWNFFAWKT